MAKAEKAPQPGDALKRRVRSVAVANRIKNPLGSPSLAIPVRDPDLVVRVVDSQLRSGRVHEVVTKGWEPVDPGDLVGKPEDYGFAVQDGRVVRGERGRDVLMKMHREDYDAIGRAKAEANVRGMVGRKGKDAVLSAVAKEAGDRGDEAADFISRSLRVTDTREAEPELESALKPTP